MKYIKNEELTFVDLNSMITEMNNFDDRILCLDTCKLIPTKECNSIYNNNILVIGEKCRIDLTQHDSFNLSTATFLDSHILHRGIVKIYGGTFDELVFTSTISNIIDELHTFNTNIHLCDDQRLYVNNYYGECNEIVDAIETTVEKENFSPAYHIDMNHPDSDIISVYKIEKDPDLADTAYVKVALSVKLGKNREENTVHIITTGGRSRTVKDIIPVLNILKQWDKVHLPFELEINVDNFTTMFPNVVVLEDITLDFRKESFKNTIKQWLKDSPEALKEALKECDFVENGKN